MIDITIARIIHNYSRCFVDRWCGYGYYRHHPSSKAHEIERIAHEYFRDFRRPIWHPS